MRIAYLLADPGIGVFGTKGASVHVQEVVRALTALGHRVTVFCVRSDESVPPDLEDLEVVRVPLGRAADAAEREVRVAEAARALAAAAVAHPDSFDLVYERYSLFSTAGEEASRALGVPLVLEVNAPLIEEQRIHRALHDAEAALAATLRQFRRAEVLVCVSAQVARWAGTVCPEAAGRAAVVPNGVDVTRICPAQPSLRRDARFTVGFVGTLKPWHGTEVLLEAFARACRSAADDWRLDICGAGPELAALRERAHTLGIAERTVFRGALPPHRVPEMLAGLDVAVAPYPPGPHYFSPLKVYEYLAAGLPVVASAVGDLPALLGDGERGLLVPPGDPAALASSLRTLAADPALRARMGTSARAAAVAEHSWTGRCAQWLGLLEGVPVP
jgi:glycosyltransferase involved in cell wall biosynthesis